MEKNLTAEQLLKRIKLIVIFFIGALIVSGITAFPLTIELELLHDFINKNPNLIQPDGTLATWLLFVYEGVNNTAEAYPFLAYGTDWLAFAHIIIAIVFVGVYYRPIRNIWIVYWAMIACVLVIPLAFICGSIRGIPFYWQLIDCSFGVFGLVPLYFLLKYIKQLKDKIGWTITPQY